jgi:hypothetical protein
LPPLIDALRKRHSITSSAVASGGFATANASSIPLVTVARLNILAGVITMGLSMRPAVTPSAVAILCAIVALPLTNHVALAQAGSAGGSVGKQDKSVSGASGSAVAPPKKNTVPSAASQSPIKSSCRNVVGEWKWYHGLIVVTFSADGVLRNTLPDHGTWTCAGGVLSGVWDTGVKEQYTLSPDGNSLLVNSSWGGGVTFAATRQNH